MTEEIPPGTSPGQAIQVGNDDVKLVGNDELKLGMKKLILKTDPGINPG